MQKLSILVALTAMAASLSAQSNFEYRVGTSYNRSGYDAYFPSSPHYLHNHESSNGLGATAKAEYYFFPFLSLETGLEAVHSQISFIHPSYPAVAPPLHHNLNIVEIQMPLNAKLTLSGLEKVRPYVYGGAAFRFNPFAHATAEDASGNQVRNGRASVVVSGSRLVPQAGIGADFLRLNNRLELFAEAAYKHLSAPLSYFGGYGQSWGADQYMHNRFLVQFSLGVKLR